MPKYAFKFISGKYTGGEFPLPDDGELLIGRASDLDLVLVEDMVSRKHAKLVAAGPTISITDLGSTNGTFVNGEKIRRSELKKNDRILIGTSILKVIDAAEMTIDERQRTDTKLLKEMMQQLGNRASESSTMSGDLQEVPLPDLLQLFATNRKSGVLNIRGANNGQIFLKAGQLQAASIQKSSVTPMKAICRMIGWSSGQFHLEPIDENQKFPDAFTESTESILIEALRQLDEIRRIQKELPAPDAKLALCIPLVPKLADLAKPELETLQSVLNFTTYQSVLDKDTRSDHAVILSVHKLLREGFIEVE
jgi:pSer/pThr/pTyr-binding forkhead associated (FHA) protein